MRYQRPQVTFVSDLTEGVYLASGSTVVDGCSYEPATVEINEAGHYKDGFYRVTIKAAHNGKVNDRRGQQIKLDFNVDVRDLSFDQARGEISGSGTSYTIITHESHHSELNIELKFHADRQPVASAVVTPL